MKNHHFTLVLHKLTGLRSKARNDEKVSIKRFSYCVIAALIFILTGCTTISGIGKDNTPEPSALVNFKPQKQIITIWRNQVGSGASRAHLHFNTVLCQGLIYTINNSGQVTATLASNGKTIWSTGTQYAASAGPAICGHYLIFATHRGEVVALDRRNGRCLWHVCVGTQILASPVIAGQVVLVKTVEGLLSGLDLATGQTRWQFTHAHQSIMLQGDSAPCVLRGVVYVGFSDGQFFALRLNSGRLLWQQLAAMPRGISELEAIVGVISDPVILGNSVYVLTYQGQLTALSAQTGEILWQRDLSSYEKFVVCGSLIVVTDDQGAIWAINRFNGHVLWKQCGLLYRCPTAPVATPQGIWVGDAEGYLHLLSTHNGCFLARCLINGSGFFVPPVCDGSGVIVRSEGGELLKVAAG